MKLVPQVKCRRCGESFSVLRSSCPSCGTRRVSQSKRTPAGTPSTTAGTAAYDRANVNTRWQMIFGLILVAAVILAVIVMVSTGLNESSYGTASKPPKAPTATQSPDVAPTPEPAPTPSPSPTPSIQTLEIVYEWEDRKIEDVSMKVGQSLPIYARILPSDVQGQVTWRIDKAGQDCFKITEDPDRPNHMTIECIAKPNDPVYLYASVYGQEAKCIFRVTG